MESEELADEGAAGRQQALAARLGVDASAASAASLRTLLKEDFERHYRSLVHPGAHALWVYRIGHWGLTQPPVVRKAVKIVHRLLNRLVIQNVYGVEIDDAAFIGRRVLLAHQQGVQIPSFSVVGDDSVIRHNVTLGLKDPYSRHEVPRLGRRVEVGTGASLIGAVTIGDDAKIGPHAIVMVDVPAGATAFSPPARIFKPESTSPEPSSPSPTSPSPTSPSPTSKEAW